MKRIPGIRLESGRIIGPGNPCFLVAEIGNNHQGDLETAKQLIANAARAGADAVKLQKRDMNAMFTEAGRAKPYTGPNSFGPTYGEHRQRLELDMGAMAELKALAQDLGLTFFASVWDEPSLVAMHKLRAWPIKIPSADLGNLPLLRKAASLGAPIILSTGMSEMDEIDLAVAELTSRNAQVAILHCNSSYPCPDSETGVRVMDKLGKRYGLPTGYSGHEQGLGPSLAAAALGACIIERHFTLDKSLPGTDHKASLTPVEFTELARLVRSMEAALLTEDKCVSPAERATGVKLKKSVVFARALPAGHVLREHDLTAKCPGDGVSPLNWDKIVGMRLTQDVDLDQQFEWNMATNAKLNRAMP